jgi:hypothetical protein
LPAVRPDKLDSLYSPADIKRFSPRPVVEGTEGQRELLPEWMPPDSYVLGWVGRNQWRKQGWLPYQLIHHLRTGDYWICRDCGRVTLNQFPAWFPESLRARPNGPFDPPNEPEDLCLHCQSPQTEKASPLLDTFLWVHAADEEHPTWPTPLLEKQFGVRPGEDVYYSPGLEHKAYRAATNMGVLYQSWDCLLYLSGGEGFGLPAWEAMCSALPVVYTNYSGHAEFLNRANAGIPVGGIAQPEGHLAIWRLVADMPQAIEAVRKLHADRELGRSLGRNGRAFVLRFTPEIQAEKWHHIFQALVLRAQ